MQVTLIRPAALTTALKLSTVAVPPIGVAYLAGALRARGHAVHVIDALGSAPTQMLPLGYMAGYSLGLSLEQTVAAIPEDSDIIGIASMFSSFWGFDKRLIRRIRDRFPNATLILGGEHASACADYVLSTTPEVDVCVRGEGEDTLCELVETVRAGASLASVGGIVWRDGDALRTNDERKRIRMLDAMAPPAWDLTPIRTYLDERISYGATSRRSMPLLATRGCPFSCTFCSSPAMWTTRWEARSPTHVVDEMAEHVRVYGAENFDLFDLTAIVSKSWIKAFARELIERRLAITWQLPSGTRSEAVDAEVVGLLAMSGCTNLNFAPESGSPAALERLNKKVDLAKLEATLRECCGRGLNVTVNLVLFPDDTLDDVRQTFEFALRCAKYGVNDIMYLPYMPYPGSEMYAGLVREGRLPPLSDAYLDSLLSQFDLVTSHSYNPRFSSASQQLLRLGFFLSFHVASYGHRPWRVLEHANNLARRAPKSRGEKMLIELVRRLGRIAVASPR